MKKNNENTIDQATLDIQNLTNHINDLKKSQIEGTLSIAGFTYLNEMTQKQFKFMEQKVKSVHPNTIQTGTVKKNGKEKVFYQTRLKGNKSVPRSYSYEGLIEKLFNFYFGCDFLHDYTFKSIFDAALDEKIRTKEPKEKTIRDDKSSYKAFITDEFGAKDIRQITKSELMEYMQIITHGMNLTKKRFYKFKGVLNLAFRYATNYEHGIIQRNIVPEDNTPFIKHCAAIYAKPEDKAFQPDEIERIRTYLWERVNKLKYDVNGYAILFDSHTGLREAEIPSLRWEDIDATTIHVHSQQNDHITENGKEYYLNETTRNEKGYSKNGRYVPLTAEVKHILNELKKKQEALGITSEWVFCKENGDWITTVGYYESLYKVCKKLGLKLTNNHAFRIALNSYVLIPMGLNVAERARILGHSVETNLKHYTFSRDKEYLIEIVDKWDAFNESAGISIIS